ncbi:hypothetical protein D3C72_1735770 [compost metagenome]
MAVDRRDQRLEQAQVGQVHQPDIEPQVGGLLRRAEQCFRIGRGRAARAFQVGARAEGARAGAGQHRHAQVVAVAHFDEVRAQFAQRGHVQRIERLGPVDRQHGDRAFGVESYGHGLPPYTLGDDRLRPPQT